MKTILHWLLISSRVFFHLPISLSTCHLKAHRISRTLLTPSFSNLLTPSFSFFFLLLLAESVEINRRCTLSGIRLYGDLKMSLNIKIFMWYLFKRVVLTKNNLSRRNWYGSLKCCFS